ncbi:MAG: competence/damage-inducible protein A [Candidatus Njordarchaeales archaeon]
MSVEVIIIGDEVLLGIVKEENANYIIEEVTKRGFRVRRVFIIGDNINEIKESIQASLRRGTNLIITTGGLGPTEDDLTLDAISEALNIELKLDQECVEKIKKAYKGEIPEGALKMARRLEGAKIYESPLGLAPAQLLNLGRSLILVLPGPPREVRSLLPRILDDIADIFGKRAKCGSRFYVEAREAEIMDILAEIIKKYDVYAKAIVGECVKGKLPVEIVVFDKDEEKCRRRLSIAKNYFCEKVREKLGKGCID